MRWLLENIQFVIAVAGVIAWWLNQRHREKANEATDFDGDGTPERGGLSVDPEEAERTRQVQEEVRRKIAARQGRPATPPPARTQPLEEAPPPLLEDPVQEMLKDLQKRLIPTPPPAPPAIDETAVARQRELEERYRALEAEQKAAKARAAALAMEKAETPQIPATNNQEWLEELRDPKRARHAILTRELLGPPVALR